jgi:nucleoid-associated protein YgaU
VAISTETKPKPAVDAQQHSEFSSEPDALVKNDPPARAPKTGKTHHADLEVPAASGTNRVYVVQAGQTLSSIAEEIYGNPRFWVAIQRENKSINPNHLHVGDKINLPDVSIVRPVEGVDPSGVAVDPRGGSHTTTVAATVDDATPSDGHTYKVKSGDNLYKIARAELGSGRLAEELYELNKDVIGPDKARLKLGMVLKLPTEPAHLASSMVIP